MVVTEDRRSKPVEIQDSNELPDPAPELGKGPTEQSAEEAFRHVSEPTKNQPPRRQNVQNRRFNGLRSQL